MKITPSPKKGQFVISNSIPLPSKKSGTKKDSTMYPFDQMKVGDSFAVTLKGDDTPRKITKRLYMAGYAYRRKVASARFAVRTVKEYGTTRVRIWRIK